MKFSIIFSELMKEEGIIIKDNLEEKAKKIIDIMLKRETQDSPN